MNDNPGIEGEDVEAGGNFVSSELALGHEGRTYIKSYERHSRSLDKTIAAIHQDIVGFGRVLLRGQEMYPSRKELGFWIERRGLNTGKLAKHQTERTACMSIARLVDDGAEIEDGDNVMPVKLDLSGCKMTTPTDIMKWARRHHRHLFPQLAAKEDRPEPKDGDVKTELRTHKAAIADRDETISVLEAKLAELDAEDQGAADLRAENARLKAANAILRAEPGHDLKPALKDAGAICSFCLKISTEVAHLIKSDKALICNECVALCVDLIAELENGKTAGDSDDADADVDVDTQSALSWSGSDATFWTARHNGLCYKIKKARGKWNVVVYENGSDGQQLNKRPFTTSDEGKAAAEADYAEHCAG